jgi:hypothetical protein
MFSGTHTFTKDCMRVIETMGSFVPITCNVRVREPTPFLPSSLVANRGRRGTWTGAKPDTKMADLKGG